MKIILLSKLCRQSGSRPLSLTKLVAALVLLFVGVTSGGIWAGYQLGVDAGVAHSTAEGGEGMLRQVLAAQQEEIFETRRQSQEHLDALALRLGQMQSNILRIDALGERLAKKGGLDITEFSFGQEPGQGGIDPAVSAQSVEVSELLADMERLSRSIDDRAHKLELMEVLIFNTGVHQDLKPSGRPVTKGWVSSRYGYRKDPFTGKKAFHRGVDVAGKKNSDIIAVAAGVVTWAGEKSNYGSLVEIRHTDGYMTRYGHNSKLLVKSGELVTKGQVIAAMGSSGRSTGPHVHFEIARNGQAINPSKYLRSK
ncbi:MAG: M23 family metallopeptidase [Candidatus Sedimenticola sp. (ex Thyasira tokunagai)]